MKKFINSVENAEKEMIEGMLKAYPDKMTELDCGAVLVRKNKKKQMHLPLTKIRLLMR